MPAVVLPNVSVVLAHLDEEVRQEAFVCMPLGCVDRKWSTLKDSVFSTKIQSHNSLSSVSTVTLSSVAASGFQLSLKVFEGLGKIICHFPAFKAVQKSVKNELLN